MASYVMANGSGLISGNANAFNHFNVYTDRSSRLGDLSVKIEGPSRPTIRYNDEHNGTVRVSYMPYSVGTYQIIVRYDGVQVMGSPFTVAIRADEPKRYLTDYKTGGVYVMAKSTRNVKASGRGLITGLTHIKNEITVDVRDAAPGRLKWSIEGPGHVESHDEGLKDGIYRMYYKPYQPGEYIIKIKYAERDVIGSPFTVLVM